MVWCKNSTLQKPCRKLFDFDNPNNETARNESDSDGTKLLELSNQFPVFGPVNNNDIQEWFDIDLQFETITDNVVTDLFTNPQVEYDKNDDEIQQTMSHIDGLRPIKAALTYIEKQEETTAHDLLLLQCWRKPHF